MASSVLVSNKLKISYKVGVNSMGKDVYKNQSFNNINVAATDDQLIGFADAIADLLDYNLTTIGKQNDYIITRF